MRPANFLAVDTEDSFIRGRSIRVVYQPSSQTLTLYRVEGRKAVQASKPSMMGYLAVDGKTVCDFTSLACTIERNISGKLGTGERMTITSYSPSLRSEAYLHTGNVRYGKRGALYANFLPDRKSSALCRCVCRQLV